MSAPGSMNEVEYLARLGTALKKCETMSQFRSVYARAGVSSWIDDVQTSTATCLAISAIVVRERERVQAQESS